MVEKSSCWFWLKAVRITACSWRRWFGPMTLFSFMSHVTGCVNAPTGTTYTTEMVLKWFEEHNSKLKMLPVEQSFCGMCWDKQDLWRPYFVTYRTHRICLVLEISAQLQRSPAAQASKSQSSFGAKRGADWHIWVKLNRRVKLWKNVIWSPVCLWETVKSSQFTVHWLRLHAVNNHFITGILSITRSLTAM